MDTTMAMKTALNAVLVAAVALVMPLGSATAQEADGVILAILRECARIADMPARVACYDRNIGVDVAQGTAANGAGSPSTDAAKPTGFGANQLRRPATARAARPDSAATSVTATVTAATQRTPGVWLLTLDDGSQWEFVDAVPQSFDPPRTGQAATISAAAMGSYIVRLQGQQGVRIRRVR